MLPQALKLKVIQQYEAGKLQKDIAHDLGISTGSVSTILKASRGRQKHEDNSNSNLSLSTLQEQQPIASEESKPEEYTAINIGTPPSICNGSPSSNASYIAGDGLKPDPDSEPDPKTSGGPLKFFLNKIVSPTAVAAVIAIAPTTEYNHSIPSNPVYLNVNPIKADEDIRNSNLHPPAPVSTLSIPPKAEAFPDRSLFIKDPETEMQVNIIESDTNVKYISKDQDVNSQNETTEEEEREFEQSELQPSLSDSENPLMDWDSDEVWERRFLRIVFDDKKQRRHELLMIDRRKSKLEEWRKRLDQREFNLKDRETRVFEAESYLSVAKKLQEKLQEMKLTLEDALPWIETIREKAEAENIDIRTSGINLTRELRLYRHSQGCPG